LFIMSEKAYTFPLLPVKYPDSDAAAVNVPVFARRLPSADVPFIRCLSVPSTPATGSESRNELK